MAYLQLNIQASNTEFGGSNLFMIHLLIHLPIFCVFAHTEKAEKDKERKTNQRNNPA